MTIKPLVVLVCRVLGFVLFHFYPIHDLSTHTKLVVMDRLQGEQPLSQKNHNQFTDAYDKHILLKIGKSTCTLSNAVSVRNNMPSPPRLHIPRRESRDFKEPAQIPSTNARNIPPLPSPVVAVQSPWISQHASTTPYSPTADFASALPSSFSVNYSNSHNLIDSSSRLKRTPQKAGYQQESVQQSNQDAIYHTERRPDANRSLTMDAESFRPALRLGPKRRALSPASEITYHDDRRSSQASSQSTEPSAFQLEPIHQPQRTGSLSSTTSSAHPQSSTSSYLLSATSSLTSASTLDFATLRSPAEFAPPDVPPRISTYNSDLIIPSRKPPELLDTSLKPVSNVVRPTASRTGPSLICSCCPKKPKRFENEKQLRSVMIY